MLSSRQENSYLEVIQEAEDKNEKEIYDKVD